MIHWFDFDLIFLRCSNNCISVMYWAKPNLAFPVLLQLCHIHQCQLNSGEPFLHVVYMYVTYSVSTSVDKIIKKRPSLLDHNLWITELQAVIYISIHYLSSSMEPVVHTISRTSSSALLISLKKWTSIPVRLLLLGNQLFPLAESLPK